jgi:acetyl esterase/lipase
MEDRSMNWRWGFLVLFLAGAARAESQITTTLDVVYAKVGDRELKLDLARPADKGPHPAVVVIHGGGWRMGNKRDVRPWIEALAQRGYVAAGVAYRLAPDHVFPAQIEDCKTAVRFLRTNADTYGIDKDRVAAMGYSAGGHLACLLGLTDDSVGFDGKLYPKESSRVCCVVDYFGPTDLAGFGKDESAQRSMLGPLIGAKFSEKPEAHERASPVKYVKKGAPPFLIFHGTKDWIVPIEQSRALANKLKDVGGSVKLVEVVDEGHGWAGKAGMGTTAATLEFLAEHLKK